MANKFLNGIDTTSLSVNSQYSLPTSDGSNKQVLQTDGNGNVTFSDVDLVGAQAHYVYYEVKNSTGSTIPKGAGVMAVGTDGNSGHILVSPMVADGSVEPKYFVGVTADAIGNGQTGEVIHFGMLTGFDTSGFTDGDVLYCDPANDGDFVTSEPAGPNLKLAIAFVVSAANNGKIFIRVQGNEGLHELHDVNISSQADGDLLQWNATSGVWENKTLASIADARYVNVSGDTMTGNLTVNDGGTSASITLDPSQQTSAYALSISLTNDGVKFDHNSNSRGYVFARNGTNILTLNSNTTANFTNHVYVGGWLSVNNASGSAPLQVNVGTSIPVSTAANGTLSIGSVSSTSTPSIMGRVTSNVPAVYMLSAATNNNSSGDMVFNVRENDNSTFSTLTNTAFKFSHFTTDLVSILRNGQIIAENGIVIKGGGWSDNITGSNLLRLESSDTVGAGVTFKNNTGSYWTIYNGDTGAWVGEGALNFVYSNGTDAATAPLMTLNKNGRLGIGVGDAAPSNTLHVKSDDNEGIFMEGTSTGHWFNFKSSVSNLWSMGAQSGLMGWYNRDTSTYVMKIADSGEVSIGTDLNTQQLNVGGDIIATKSGSTRVYVESTDNSNAGTFFVVKNDGTQVANTTLRVDNSGNFQLYNGTTTETKNLEIYPDGSIYGNGFLHLLKDSNNNGIHLGSGNNARINMDARGSGDGARIHKWNRNYQDTAYLPYYENWYDGDSYHSIGIENDVWQLGASLSVGGNITASGSVFANGNTLVEDYFSETVGDRKMHVWNKIHATYSDDGGADTYWVINTNVPQESYAMGGFELVYENDYDDSPDGGTIKIYGYWNPESNSGFIGFKYTSDNPNLNPTIQVGADSNGKTVFIISGEGNDYAQLIARNLWFGFNSNNTGNHTWGDNWSINTTSDISGFTNLDTLTNVNSSFNLQYITSNGATTTDAITINRSNGAIIRTGASTDAFGYNSNYGHYIWGNGDTYIYGNGTFFDGSTHRTLIHSGNIGSQSVSNADNLDNLNSTQFVRSDQDDEMNGWLKTYSTTGAGDNIRHSLSNYDDTAQAEGVGGQLVLGYKYTDAGDYTEGAILKMYKENGTNGHYGSGLKFQVRNNGNNLSTKMTLDPSGNLDVTGNLGVGWNPAPYKLSVDGYSAFRGIVGIGNITSGGNDAILLYKQDGTNILRIYRDQGYTGGTGTADGVELELYNGSVYSTVVRASGASVFGGRVETNGSNSSSDSIRFYNTDGNYAYIRVTSASNSNNLWIDGPLGNTQWYAWDNPSQDRTTGVFTTHHFGTGRGTSTEYVRIDRGETSGFDAAATQRYYIRHSGTSYFNGGSLVVGDTSTNFKFDVNGTARVRDYNSLTLNGVELKGYPNNQLWFISNNSAEAQFVVGTSWDWDKQVEFRYNPNTVGTPDGTLSIGQLQKNAGTWTHGNTDFYQNGSLIARFNDKGFGLGSTSIGVISSGVPTLNLDSPNTANLSSGIIYRASGVSKAFHYWESGYLVHQTQGGGHKFNNGAANYLRVESSGNIITEGILQTKADVYHENNPSIRHYRSGNDAWCHQDARAEGNFAALYKYTQKTDSAYGYYREYWWDGNSYQSIRQQDDAFRFTCDVIAFDTSDKRLKKNITPIDGAIDKVLKLGGYEFDWDEEKQRHHKGHDVGVIAQEVEEIYPQAVETRDDGYKAVDYTRLVPVLIEAIKEQQKQIDELKAMVYDNAK